jgi:dipeptidyl aminopeptidase/acylaminoacyl peptidase
MSTTLTPEILWQLNRVGQPRPLPDGSAAVVPVKTYDLDANGGTTLLHLLEAEGTSKQLTTRQADKPAVNRSGDTVAFCRPVADGGPAQLHVMPLRGGEARALTDFPLGAGEAKWLPDGSGLIVVVPLLEGHGSLAATGAELAARKDRKKSAIVTEDRVYRYWKRWLVTGQIHHLFHVDATTGEATDLTPELAGLLTTDAEPEGTFETGVRSHWRPR